MTTNLKLEESINIEKMIYEVREKQVMLDSDLAKLYNVETKRINEAVKNNPNKFPERYCFELSENEYNSLRSKFSTLNGRGQHRKYLPKVFTEQGVYMLATILKSNVATDVTLNIMDTFVKMKKYISNSIINNKMLINHENRILKLEDTFNKLNEKENINTIF